MGELSNTQFEIVDKNEDGEVVQISDGTDFAKKLSILLSGNSATGASGLLLLGVDPLSKAKELLLDNLGQLKVTGGEFLSTALDTASWSPSAINFKLNTSGPLYRDSDGQLNIRGPVLSDEASFRDDFAGNSLATNLTGTLTFINASITVTGIGTSFLTELDTHRYIKLGAHSDAAYALVANVLSNTELELAFPYSGANGSGAAVWSRWIPSVVTGGSIAVATSEVQLAVNTDSLANAAIDRIGDYGPYAINFAIRISQRIVNQEFRIGFVDIPAVGLASSQAIVFFNGTDNTKVGLRTSWEISDVQESVFSLPGGLTTATTCDYQLEVSAAKVTLFVNGIFVGEHKLHIPGPYVSMMLHADLCNTAAAASGTTAYIDTLFFSNHNQIQIGATPKNDPVSVRMVEDIHNITGTLTTNSTTADQIILSYTVPTGKSCWIVGYTINNGETAVRGNPVKIGRNTITNEPASPGTVDGNLFRMYNMPASTLRDEDYSGMPRRLGNAGDVIKITVTPTGVTTTVWRASMDFILR